MAIHTNTHICPTSDQAMAQGSCLLTACKDISPPHTVSCPYPGSFSCFPPVTICWVGKSTDKHRLIAGLLLTKVKRPFMMHFYCMSRSTSESEISDPALCNFPYCPSFLLGHCRTQNLCPEESSLGPFNHLLVHALWGMIHNHSAGLVVDLRIYLCVSNEVDNPFLSFRA
jgi:hypothetical protein